MTKIFAKFIFTKSLRFNTELNVRLQTQVTKDDMAAI